MKLSELICELQSVLMKEGDLPVVTQDETTISEIVEVNLIHARYENIAGRMSDSEEKLVEIF